jgi:hypothetical protein
VNDWTHRARREEQVTEPVAAPERAAKRAAVPGGGLVPGVAGVFVCVLLIMAVGLVVAKIVSGDHHQPGPAPLTIGAHVAGLVVGVACYRLARRQGLARLSGLVGILLVAGLLLWFFWWSPG